MRTDIGRVIVERPRYGNPNGIAKTAKTALRVPLTAADWDDVDLGPTWRAGSPNRIYNHRAKELNDYLRPLESFLRRRLGRPWTKVDQEVRAAVDARSMRGRHVLQHLEQMVAVRTAVYDGKICDASAPSMSGGYWREVWGFYVHPRTGLLCYKAR